MTATLQFVGMLQSGCFPSVQCADGQLQAHAGLAALGLAGVQPSALAQALAAAGFLSAAAAARDVQH